MNIWLSSLRIRPHLSWRTGKHLHVLHVLRTYSTCLYPRIPQLMQPCWFLLRLWRNFHFLFHLVNPAVEQGELGKVHDRLLRSKACVSFQPLVFFLLWVAHTGRLDLCSKMIPLTNCLHSGESLPVPLLELIWMWWLLTNFWLAHLFKEGFHLKFSFRILFPQVVTVQMLWWLLEIEKQKSFFQIYEKE